jgi:hypothetical protein
MALNQIFENYTVASWRVGNLPPLKFPISRITENGGNRIVKRERPYRDGQKLDDTGSMGKSWTLEVIFENSIEEAGLDETTPLYPDILNQLIASFDVHEVGDLILPTRGFITARASTYNRVESSDLRDGAVVSFTFEEDNQDDVGNLQFEQYNANASARRLGEQTVFSATSEGLWSTSLGDLREFASDLEAYANYPDDVVSSIDSQVAVVIGATNQIARAFTRQNDSRRNQLGDPELSVTQRHLNETADIAGRARREGYKGRSARVPFFVRNNTDLFTVAVEVGQLPEDLLAINPEVDPLFVPANTMIHILG